MAVLAGGRPGPHGRPGDNFRNKAPALLPDQRQAAYGAIRYTDETARLWGVLDRQLDGRDYLCGDYSIADIASWPWIRGFKSHGIDPEKFPRVQAWSRRMAERPAVQAALAVGDAVRARSTKGQGN